MFKELADGQVVPLAVLDSFAVSASEEQQEYLYNLIFPFPELWIDFADEAKLLLEEGRTGAWALTLEGIANASQRVEEIARTVEEDDNDPREILSSRWGW